MAQEQEVWVTAMQALAEVEQVYAHTMDREWEQASHHAKIAIMRRLAAGTLVARASALDYRICEAFQPDKVHHKPEWKGRIPAAFWREFMEQDARSQSDWVAGDFSFVLPWADMVTDTQGAAHGVLLNRSALPAIQHDAPPQIAEVSATKSTRGRKPGNWWPDFAEELAWYIHETGFPEGTDAAGQSLIIEAVFNRMAEGGKAEPSRTQVQPVVSALLRRWRAGN